MVDEQLALDKLEIETELMKKVKVARQKMDKELREEINKMRKESVEHEKKRKEDFEKYITETQQKLEEEKKKIAEEWLETLAEKERIDRELRKQKKKEEKKFKEAQSKILGKDNTRPKTRGKRYKRIESHSYSQDLNIYENYYLEIFTKIDSVFV